MRGGAGHSAGRSSAKSRVGDAKFLFDKWSVEHVLLWLKGIRVLFLIGINQAILFLGVEDGNPPVIHAFENHLIDGKKLADLDELCLKRMRVAREASRIRILRAIGLLNHYVRA